MGGSECALTTGNSTPKRYLTLFHYQELMSYFNVYKVHSTSQNWILEMVTTKLAWPPRTRKRQPLHVAMGHTSGL